jgi:hypothetical protein
MRIEEKNYIRYLKNGHKIIDYRRKCIKDLETITNNRILKIV